MTYSIYLPRSSFPGFTVGDAVTMSYAAPRRDWWAKILRVFGRQLWEQKTLETRIVAISANTLVCEEGQPL